MPGESAISRPCLRRVRASGKRAGALLGMTLAEVLVTIAIITLFLASIYAMNSQIMLVVRSTRNQTGASRLLQERTEQLRIAGWSSITSPDTLKKLVEQPTRPEATGWLANLTDPQETVTVTGLSPLNLLELNSNIVVRRKGGTASVSSSGSLLLESLVKVDVELCWTESGRPVAPRRMSSTISPGGLVSATLSNLPYVPTSTYLGSGGVDILRPVLSTVNQVVSSTGSVTSPDPSSSPTPTPTPGKSPPKFCKHGRPWPHCGLP